jgi:cytochrome P450
MIKQTKRKLLADIYGHGNHVKKFKGYNALASQAPNTLTLTDKVQHASRRRVLSQAFSESSLRLFEPTIRSRIDRFCQVLHKLDDSGMKWTKSIDMSHQCKYLTLKLVRH